MIEIKDKKGQTAYVSYVHDCGDNPDGFYCEVYSEKTLGNKIDDLVVRPEDIYDWYQKDYPAQIRALEQYIQEYYANEELDLSYRF